MPQPPRVAVTHVVDPPPDRGIHLLQGDLARGVGRQQRLQPVPVGDALAPLEPPFGGEDGDNLGLPVVLGSRGFSI